MRWLMLSVLGVCALLDIRRLSVPLWATGAAFCAAGLCIWQRGGTGICDLCVSLIPGLLLLLYSFAAKGKAGAGDALIIMAVGMALGPSSVVVAVCTAFILAAFVAVLLMAVFKKGRSMRLPFVPFIAAGTGVALWFM